MEEWLQKRQSKTAKFGLFFHYLQTSVYMSSLPLLKGFLSWFVNFVYMMRISWHKTAIKQWKNGCKKAENTVIKIISDRTLP